MTVNVFHTALLLCGPSFFDQVCYVWKWNKNWVKTNWRAQSIILLTKAVKLSQKWPCKLVNFIAVPYSSICKFYDFNLLKNSNPIEKYPSAIGINQLNKQTWQLILRPQMIF